MLVMSPEPSINSLREEEKSHCLNKEYTYIHSMAQWIRDHAKLYVDYGK
jgi:hypothetical protein